MSGVIFCQIRLYNDMQIKILKDDQITNGRYSYYAGNHTVIKGCIYKTGMMFAALIDSNTLGIKEVNEIGQ